MALFAAASAANAQSVQDFRLPPEPTPTPSAQVEGPVDREGPVVIAPRVIPTATPTPSARPATVPTPSTTAARPAPAQPQSTVPRPAGQQQPSIQQPRQAAPQPFPNGTLPDGSATPTIESTSAPLSFPTSVAPAANGTADVEGRESATGWLGAGWLGLDWLWWFVGALGAIALGLIGWSLRQRKVAAAPAPVIEKPRVPAAAAPVVTPPASAAPDLRVEAEAISLGRSFANATLSYAITVSNLGGKPLQNLRIEADMTTAHSSLPVDQQLASASTELPDLAQIDQLSAGSAKQARGEFRLPVGQIRLIRQGKAALYVPLLRLRIHADGIEPVVKTFVVGQKQGARSGRLTPFRLDEMAQVYREIALQPLSPSLG
ncbi:hypothetical protein [Parerythrobacter lacustris]|uniref:DUF3426 domain-containing protein n=1 Tax=Parerythrobacter lacustris TaxID=2969984 RepID=A0ABT1XTF6_9SPHN|nr:hypothetical protein [Parerythrobacter lacustris]MCR2834939.1 hypothetical protein [Parerythrobacter lacustris]